MSATRSAKTFRFGPDECLVAAITDPSQAAGSAQAGSQIGAIIWGMGVAEIRVARALARRGIVAMQIRQKERAFDQLDTDGVSYCRAAIEVLKSERGIERFILMGNCGRGSICFHTSLDDPRVIALILSNPHVSEVLTISDSYKRRLGSLASWWRLLSGKADLKYHLNAASLLRTLIVGRLARTDEKALIAKSTHNKDLTLPDRVQDKLKKLAQRGLKTLMVFSQKDAGLDYFRKLFGRSFNGVSDIPGVSFEVLPTAAHVISLDDSAAGALADIIARWVEQTNLAPARLPSPMQQTRRAHFAAPPLQLLRDSRPAG